MSAEPDQCQSSVDGKPAESGEPDQRVETMDYAAMMRRMLAAWVRRLSDADIEDVGEFVGFGDELLEAQQTVVDALRAREVPWSAIARAFDSSRQNVQQRFGA